MTLIDQLKTIPDPRCKKGRKHPLWFILFLSLVGSLCNHWGYRPLAAFSRKHHRALCELVGLPLTTAVPSYSTFRRVFQQVDAAGWVEVFNAWALRHLPNYQHRWLAIDGKSIKCTSIGGNSKAQDFVSLVSVYGQHDEGVVQLQLLHNKAGSEIEVAKQLLRRLPPELAQTVTLDALHAQTETLKTFSDLNLHYVIGLKANQPKLVEAADDLLRTTQPQSTAIESEQRHGREVRRTVSVYAAPAALQAKWLRLTSLIWVERRGKRGSTPYHETHWYLSSAAFEAQTFLSLIRGHWHIENRLHWVKDVTFREDYPPRRGGHAPVTWAIFHSFCITIARRQGFRTVPDCQRDLANQLHQVFHLLV